MLFGFSALSFNSHRIHLDRDYARDIEGYPDLVVNGGLTTLLMTEVVRSEMGLAITSLAVTNRAPLFCGRPITFFGNRTGVGGRILALDDRGALAAEMEFTANGN
jgi:3-methylfumaryl-CoA hydratase